MPQPIRKSCHAQISGLAQRPQHAAVMGRIVGISGRLEADLGWLLALLSGGSAPITVSMFHSVVSTDAQRAMLMAAADHVLQGPERDAFDDLMEDFRPRYGERSRLVHNIWGHSDDHPDKALWWKATDLAQRIAQIGAAQTHTEFMNAGLVNISTIAMAYTVKDLENVEARLNEYLNRVGEFIRQLIANHPALVAAASAATNVQPTSAQSQMDLPQSPQTGPSGNPQGG